MSKEEQTKKIIEIIKKTKDESIKYQAIDELGDIGKKASKAIPLLIEISKNVSESNNIRTKAIWSLGEIGSGSSVETIIDILQKDKDQLIRIISLESLGKIAKRPEIVLPVLGSLTVTEPLDHIKERIPKVLSNFGEKANTILFKIVENSEGKIKHNAILALGESKEITKEIINYLRSWLDQTKNTNEGFYFALALYKIEGEKGETFKILHRMKEKDMLGLVQQSMLEAAIEQKKFPKRKVVVKEKEEKTTVKEVKPQTFESDISYLALERINKILFNKDDFIVKNFNDIIEKKETNQIEFKSALRFNYSQKKVMVVLEQKIINTIVAFMNTEGGVLLIGVNNDGKIMGLKGDYHSLGKGKQNSDGFCLLLNDLYNKNGIQESSVRLVKEHIEKIDNKEFCIITVEKSSEPIFLKDKQSLFVRMGNSTRLLKPNEAIKYSLNHFKK